MADKTGSALEVAKRAATPIDVATDTHVAELLAAHPRVVFNFWAEWAPPCLQMNSVFAALAASTTPAGAANGKDGEVPKAEPVLFARVAAEQFPGIAAAHRVGTVPCFLLMYTGRVAARVEGADPPALAKKVQWLASSGADVLEAAALAEATRDEEIMLFMKGSPDTPRCGFSRQIVDLLRRSGIVFGHRDVLKDPWLREGLKKLHNWPTYPQLYARGRLIGGLDIVRELADAGELIGELAREDKEPEDSAGKLAPSGAKEAANAASVAEQGGAAVQPPATVSAFPSVTAAATNGPAVAADPSANGSVDESGEQLHARLRSLVARSPVMLFMKGSPDEPRCGFSRKIVALLREQGVAFDSFDILSDPAVRQGLKDLFSWPTYPQLYSKGTLIGGLDIVQELVSAGALKDELELAA